MSNSQIWSKEIEAWVKETEVRMMAVVKASAQAAANEMRKTKREGGKLPIRTGNLRRSLMGSTSGPIMMGEPGQQYSDGGGDISLTIATATPDQTIYLGFQANYARRMEYGFVGADSLGRVYNQAGHGFVAAVVQRWPQIVNEQAVIIRNRVLARATAT